MARPHKPRVEGGCWGGLSRSSGYCDHKAQKDRLTCYAHRAQEAAARQLKRKLEQQEKQNEGEGLEVFGPA